MKTLLFLALFAFSTNYSDVYICDSKNAKAYHSRTNCKGLNKCSHEIIKVSLSEAQEYGRVGCRICVR